MIELNIDITKNILFVNLKGVISDKDIDSGIRTAGTLLPKLQENYSLIMDLSEYKESSIEQAALFNKIIKNMNAKVKIKKVIRIVRDSKSLIQNFCKMDKLFKMNNVMYVFTMEEAMKFNDGL
jgi:hypothetical protein